MDTKYVVVVKHSFDRSVAVYDCGNQYDKAKNFLRKIWEEYYNEELDNNSDLNENGCFYEEEYARITWGDGCETDFTLTILYKGE